MKQIILLMLLIQSGLAAWAASGKPCLPKDPNRTKEQLITELFKTENSNLLEEYRINVRTMLNNLGEAPLKDDADLKEVIRTSEVLTKSQLNSRSIYSINNGFTKTDGSIAYIDQSLKDDYKYLVYKNVVYAALTCGNPAKILPNKSTGSVQHKTDTIYHTTVIYDTLKKFVVQEQQIQNTSGCNDCPQPSLNNSIYDNYMAQRAAGRAQQGCCGMRTTNYPPCTHTIPNCGCPQPRVGVGVSVNVGVGIPPTQRVVVVREPVYVRQGVVIQPPQNGGPVTPNPTIGGGPVTPNNPTTGNQGGGPTTPGQSGSGGPVTPRSR